MEYDKFNGLIVRARTPRVSNEKNQKKDIPKELLTINRTINQAKLNQL